MKIAFKENQKFTQWWLWLILFGIGVVPVFGIYKQLILGEKFGDNQMSDSGLIIFSLFVMSLIALFWFIKLKTVINQNKIEMSFFPFVKKSVNWKDVKQAEIVNYGFVGYGIRLGSKYGIIYNIKGNKGLAIELQNGNKFVIGTQKEAELNTILNRISEQQSKL